ncbi:hypothetical protein OA86_02345 [Kaistella jeonii]|uniref:Uncharacterized protein n=1 Tax=Kaistella jeonii TaxID=266749 RepID=A0A0C1D9Y3_9FLAO|nr:hypothetical protein OA86_02345 [Kaistella jeonii]
MACSALPIHREASSESGWNIGDVQKFSGSQKKIGFTKLKPIELLWKIFLESISTSIGIHI